MSGAPVSATGGTRSRNGTAGNARSGDDAGASAGSTSTGAPQAGLFNFANLLTMLRLLLVPGFVALFLAEGGYDPAWRSLAWAAFAIAMITDLFDGHVARTYNLVTDFGKIADPIADKAIMGAALLCLSAVGDLPWWVTAVILVREIGITVLRFWVIRFGVIPASRGGKLKTLAQGTAVGMYVLALTGPLATLRFWVMGVALVLTVVTGLDYVQQAVTMRRRGLRAMTALSSGSSDAGPVVSAQEAVVVAAEDEAVLGPAAGDASPDTPDTGQGDEDRAGPERGAGDPDAGRITGTAGPEEPGTVVERDR